MGRQIGVQNPGATADLSRPVHPIMPLIVWRTFGRLLPVLAAVFIFASPFTPQALAQGSVATDKAALEALYDATGGPNWITSTNWKNTGHLTNWAGVDTNLAGRVTHLNLGVNQLTGEIPVELGQLYLLEVLNLSGNRLTGEIPAELGQLSRLRALNLSGNRLTGEIPAELGQLSRLRALYLSGNRLTGEIPAELGQLYFLEDLYLGVNRLTGEIPAELGQLYGLGRLYLGGNRLTGEIPAELGQLYGLEDLALIGNRLTGEIPVELGNLAQLERLYLHGNQLTGEIPAELGQLYALERLYLHGNQLTGEIPAELGQLYALERLYLYGNQLTGEIPAELGQLYLLEVLHLSGNRLTGEIPVELGNLTQLRFLSLSGNRLTGEIPVELGNLTQLRFLYLYGNQLTGEIPVELGNLTQLRFLYLYGNRLTGEIPVELGNLAQLERLYLHGNQLTGEIPSWLVNLAELRELSLWSNELAGTIPLEVAPAQTRAVLRVFYVATRGGNWTDNTNWGSLAVPLSEWYGVTTDADGRVTSLSLFGNGLTGTIGAELGVLTRLTELELGGNQLTGTLPSQLGNLANLQALELGGNQLTGTIPSSFTNLGAMEGFSFHLNLGLCAQEDAAIQIWLSRIDEVLGPDCSPSVRLSVNPSRLVEGSGPTPVTVTATHAAVSSPTIVSLLVGGSAKLGVGQDYTLDKMLDEDVFIEDALTIPAFAARGSTILTFTPLDDSSVEGEENIIVQAYVERGGKVEGSAILTLSDGEGRTSPPLTGDHIYYFPHLAVGASWQTTITYINYSPEEVSCQTDFISDHGSPLMVSFAGLGTVVSRTDVLPPGGSVHQETNVELSAPLAPGWARSTCSGPVKASLLFRQRNSEGVPVAEAGVNAAVVPAKRFVTFAEQAAGQSGTGVAYANPSSTEALITFTAKDAAGQTLASENLTVLPGGHGAQNMASLFGLPGFSGSLEVTSTEPIVSLSLNAEAAPVFSSLPPGEPDAAAQRPTTYYFPHLAVGASWQTTLTYINDSSREVACVTEFLSDHGTPLMVSFPGRGTVMARTDVLPPGGSVHEQTDVDLGSMLVPGWAKAACTGPVKASLLFRQYNSEGIPVAEAGVNATAVPATRFVTFAEQEEGMTGTAVAYANPSETAAHVTFTAKDTEGQTLASVVRTLLSEGHDAQVMSALFGFTNFIGSLEITSTEPIVSLSLNFEATPVFSSLPPGEVEESAP